MALKVILAIFPIMLPVMGMFIYYEWERRKRIKEVKVICEAIDTITLAVISAIPTIRAKFSKRVSRQRANHPL